VHGAKGENEHSASSGAVVNNRYLCLYALVCLRSRKSSVSLMTKLRDGRQGNRVLNPRRDRHFSSPQRHDRRLGPPSLLTNEYRVVFPPRLKKPEHKDAYSPPLVPRVRMPRAIPPLPLTSS
jgi:hypothetical protein